MEKITEKNYPIVRQEGDGTKIILPGYPTYPASEDIYAQCKQEMEINPEDILNLKQKEEIGINNQKNAAEDITGGDLDVPGSELDDNLEAIGSEDEENNLYSLGGDNHDND